MSENVNVMKFQQVTVIGVGLLGGSFALAMRHYGYAEKIVGVSRRLSSAKKALELGVVDEVTDNIKDAVRTADVVLIATPMLSMESVLEQIVGVVPKDCLITDVGSVKQSLIREASRHDLFVQKHLILTETQLAKPEFVSVSETLWQGIGARVVKMSAQEHDRTFAYTSHLPHVVAYALVNNLHQNENSQQLFEFASAGFYDFTRIASSDPVMWRDICLTNADEVLKSVRGFSAQLSRLEEAIETNDAETLKTIFNDAKQARDEGLITKQQK